jgi:hypothetical protein
MMRNRSARAARVLLGAAALAFGLAAATDETSRFLERHWSDPIAPQGKPPAAFSAIEASLDPQACGSCHPRQLEDWRTSLHSRAIGPGILWQFHVMGQEHANACMRCHAPLAEQKALLAIERGWANAPAAPRPGYVPADLHRQGLVCAACHVRRHERFGPPAREGAAKGPIPHGGFTASAAFGDSRFCSSCHQFPPSGPSLNGKPLENTHEEWRGSPAAREGRSCQACHMPDRRHLWRGIHDREMTRQALAISFDVGGGRARARLANVGAGHHFPTYVVPEVVATLQLVEAGGGVLAELARKVIARRVDLRLTEELFDTRIPAGGEVRLEATLPTSAPTGSRVELVVRVDPASHYQRTFADAQARQRLSPEAAALLAQALARAKAGAYELHRESRPLPAR